MATARNLKLSRTITLKLVLVCLNIFIVPCRAGQMAANENGWVQNPTNRHYYKLTGGLSWLRAEDQAHKWGGHLVTINNRGEELWLRSQFGADEYLWIGFTDIFAEGNWQWISGESTTYTNWWLWEPNDEGAVGEIEGAAIMNWGGAQVINGEWFYYYGDGWNDNSIDHRYRGIVEIPQLIVTFWDKEEPTREVSGAAADGASEVVIRISGLPENAGPGYVQISLPNGEEDGSLDPNIQILNGVFEQTYVAPKDFVRTGHEEDLSTDKREIKLSITTRTGGAEVEHQPFYLVKPPLVLFHGLFSSEAMWTKGFSGYVAQHYSWLIYPMHYDNDTHFQNNLAAIGNQIRIAIMTAREQGYYEPIVVKRADIVAHSMGGVLTNQYIASTIYRDDVHKLVTIDTPHSGSNFANFLMNLWYESGPLPRVLLDQFDVVGGFWLGMYISGGAVEDLQIGSAAMNRIIIALRDPGTSNVPSAAIQGQGGKKGLLPDSPGMAIDVLYRFLYWLDSRFLGGKFFGDTVLLPGPLIYYPSKVEQAIFEVEDNVNGANSDYVVDLLSQRGGCSVVIPIGIKDHINCDSDDDVRREVCTLLNASVSDLDLAGFNPVFMAPRFPAIKPTATYGVTTRGVGEHTISIEDFLSIVAPADGSTFKPGDTVTVEVYSDSTSAEVVCLAPGQFMIDDSLPIVFTFEIPKDWIGPMQILVLSVDESMGLASDSVEIRVEKVEAPAAIALLPASRLYMFMGATCQLAVVATYPDGVICDVTSLPETNYRSSDLNVIQVTPGGLITAKSQGWAVVIIENSGMTEEIEVVVAPASVPSTPQLVDDFNDNAQDPKWDLLEHDHGNCWLAETNQRLELRSTGGSESESVAMYRSRAWKLAGPRDFAFQVDFHYSDLTGKEGMLFLLLTSSTGDSDDRMAFAAGYDRDGPCFYYDVFDAGEKYHSDRVLRTVADGTLYVRYVAESDELHLNYSGRDNNNSWQVLPGLLRGLWVSGPLSIGVGGFTAGAKLDSGEAYLDNFVIETGDIVHPADDNCNYAIGDLEMAVYRARWREGGVTDKDLRDAELLSKAKRYYWNPVNQKFKVAEGNLTYIQKCSGTLEAGQVVGGSDSTATGSLKVLATEDGSIIKLEVEHTVAEPTLIRICEGGSGTVGTVVLSFENPFNPFTHYFTEDEINQMEDRDDVYIDIVDASHSQGAIRGQIICEEDFCTGEGAAALLEGSLGGCLVNNESNGGGNGFRRLCYTDFPNQSAYDWCGLNFEHIFNGVDSYDTPYGIYDQGRSRFSPRKDPCKLVIHSSKSASLIWAAEDSIWGMDTEMRYTLKGPHYVDLECRLVPREYHSYRGWLSAFWASYMNHAKDRKIYFYGIDLSTGREDWITWGEDLEQNRFEAGVISHVNAPDLPYDPEVYSGDIVANANKKFIKPFYFGLVDGDGVDSEGEGMHEGEIWTGSNDADAMVYIMMFDRDEPIRFCMWNWGPPFGTGLPSNPAWDWQYVILDPHVGQEYTFRARLVFKQWEGIEDVVNEYETWMNEISGEAKSEMLRYIKVGQLVRQD